ncbi:hypothetical protein BJF93_07075 [Xaviernesmea oryzae]|uniref:Uncharacterized protein n=1 Tax=Xaviernesmea oryzae TaxID=464029 RepID=A0A1Q9AXI4_9HYPH|nr:hypothetical protein BJF93_07075 [Xaviernesmea oryzae]
MGSGAMKRAFAAEPKGTQTRLQTSRFDRRRTHRVRRKSCIDKPRFAVRMIEEDDWVTGPDDAGPLSLA